MIEATASVLVALSYIVVCVLELLISFCMQRSTYCSGDCNVDLQEFGRKCQRSVLHSLIRENINNGDDIRECDWLEHLIREQNLQGKRSQLAAGPFQSCRH